MVLCHRRIGLTHKGTADGVVPGPYARLPAQPSGRPTILHDRPARHLPPPPLLPLRPSAAAAALPTAGPDENAAHCTTLNGTTIDCNPRSTLIDGVCLSCGESHELQWLAP